MIPVARSWAPPLATPKTQSFGPSSYSHYEVAVFTEFGLSSVIRLGRKAAIAKVFREATWQRCRVHFMRNVLVKVPRTQKAMVAAMVRTIFAPPDATHVARQLKEVAATMKRQSPIVAELHLGCQRSRHSLLSLSFEPLAQDLVDQLTRVVQRRDRTTNQRGRNFPQRRGGASSHHRDGRWSPR